MCSANLTFLVLAGVLLSGHVCNSVNSDKKRKFHKHDSCSHASFSPDSFRKKRKSRKQIFTFRNFLFRFGAVKNVQRKTINKKNFHAWESLKVLYILRFSSSQTHLHLSDVWGAFQSVIRQKVLFDSSPNHSWRDFFSRRWLNFDFRRSKNQSHFKSHEKLENALQGLIMKKRSARLE